MGTKFDGDRLSRGTKWVGDHLSMGTKFLGTICPWGQKVGDQKSGDQMGSGPNASQPSTTISFLTLYSCMIAGLLEVNHIVLI